jgi:hypothetical protein
MKAVRTVTPSNDIGNIIQDVREEEDRMGISYFGVLTLIC